MNSLASKFNLKLRFTTNSGAYLANVHVTTQDTKGEVVLNVISDGPFLFATLPTGQYKVIAPMDDQAIAKSVHIFRKHDSRLEYRWVQSKDDLVPAPEEKAMARKFGQIRDHH